jgi:hypothetical protein
MGGSTSTSSTEGRRSRRRARRCLGSTIAAQLTYALVDSERERATPSGGVGNQDRQGILSVLASALSYVFVRGGAQRKVSKVMATWQMRPAHYVATLESSRYGLGKVRSNWGCANRYSLTTF